MPPSKPALSLSALFPPGKEIEKATPAPHYKEHEGCEVTTKLADGTTTMAMRGGLKRGPWTEKEDKLLEDYVRLHGERNWSAVSRVTGLQRCGKSCCLRWRNHLRPDPSKGPLSPEEERKILRVRRLFGDKWARISSLLPGRTDNEIKKYCNTRLERRHREGLPLYQPDVEREIALRRARNDVNPGFANASATSNANASLLSPQDVDGMQRDAVCLGLCSSVAFLAISDASAATATLHR